MRDPGRYDPPLPEKVVASIATRMGYGDCAGWLETLATATTRPANLGYYTTAQEFLLPSRWGQPRGVHIKSDFWRGGESPFSRETVLRLLPLSRGWETDVLEELLSMKEGWRALGVGFEDCGRLVASCSLTDVPRSRVDTFADRLMREDLPAAPTPDHALVVECDGGQSRVRLEPAGPDRVRYSTQTAAWSGSGSGWVRVPETAWDALPALQMVASDTRSKQLARRTLRVHPCAGSPPVPNPPPIPDPPPKPPSPPDEPPTDGRPTPRVRALEILGSMQHLMRPDGDLGIFVIQVFESLIAWKRRSD